MKQRQQWVDAGVRALAPQAAHAEWSKVICWMAEVFQVGALENEPSRETTTACPPTLIRSSPSGAMTPRIRVRWPSSQEVPAHGAGQRRAENGRPEKATIRILVSRSVVSSKAPRIGASATLRLIRRADHMWL
jgi:hypothetical protein